MNPTTSNQMDDNTDIRTNKKFMGDSKMNHASNNINLATRISDSFRGGSISKLIAGAAVGLVLTIGVAMPGAAQANVSSVSGSTSDPATNFDFGERFHAKRNVPSDTDDGPTEREVKKQSNSAGSDTDGDGLSDRSEIKKYGTDPNNPDTDSDGMSYGEEVSNGTDPNKPDGPSTQSTFDLMDTSDGASSGRLGQ